jgi:hypothetical protein
MRHRHYLTDQKGRHQALSCPNECRCGKKNTCLAAHTFDGALSVGMEPYDEALIMMQDELTGWASYQDVEVRAA